MTLATAHKHITRRGIGYRGSNHFRGSERKTATRQMRDRVERIMKESLACDCCSDEIKALFNEWIANRENTLKTNVTEVESRANSFALPRCSNVTEGKEIADKLIPLMEKCGCDICKQLLELRHSLVKKSQWIFGGDGWGYDIGFGGLDHVLASGEDVNVVVVDTEVYSNTGGQSSNEQNFRWTFCPAGAVAKLPPQGRQPQHATSGKKIRKKDLGMIAKSYGYVYVAQVAMGASQAQYFCRRLRTPLKSKSNEVSNVIKEAFILRFLRSLSKVHWTFFTYHGPSLIICYAPCINHGIKIGMGRTQNEEKKAVECGYWHLWHYNPAEEEEGKNGFHLDSKEPDWSKLLTVFNLGIRCSQPQHRDFIMGEVRYNSLMKTFPQEAEELFVATERNAKLRYEGYKKLSKM